MRLIFILLILSSISFNTEAFDGSLFATTAAEHYFAGTPVIRPGCNSSRCTGHNPRAETKIGYEFAFGGWKDNKWSPIFQIGYKHRSVFFSGTPFNNRNEIRSENIFIEVKIGGLR